MHIDLLSGWVWLVLWVLLMGVAVTYCAALEALYPEEDSTPTRLEGSVEVE